MMEPLEKGQKPFNTALPAELLYCTGCACFYSEQKCSKHPEQCLKVDPKTLKPIDK